MKNEMKLIMENWRKNTINEAVLEESAIDLVKKQIDKEKESLENQQQGLEESITVVAIVSVVKLAIAVGSKFALGSIILKALDSVFKKIFGDDTNPTDPLDNSFLDNLSTGADLVAKKLTTFGIGTAVKMYIKWKMPNGQEKERALEAVDNLEKYISFIVLLGYFAFEISTMVVEKGMSFKEIITKIASDLQMGGSASDFIEAVDTTIDFTETGVKGSQAASSQQRAAFSRELLRSSTRAFQAIFGSSP